MNTFVQSLKTSVIILALFTLFLGVIYPYFMWGVGHLFFRDHANGTLLYHPDGKVLGSALIAQNFTGKSYFHPRPSVAGVQGFDAVHSSASNLGPTSQKLIDLLNQRAINFRNENNISQDALIPSDAVTTSASGLDPHISVENAKLQSSRVAKARKISQDALDQLIENHTEGQTLGLFGEKRINVLKLNIALDELTALGS